MIAKPRAPISALPLLARPPRVIIGDVSPVVSGGRYAVKRIVGDTVEVFARISADGHDHLAAALLFRQEGAADWARVPMRPVEDDLWTGQFVAERIGRFEYAVEAWIDTFASWLDAFERRCSAGQAVAIETPEGAALIDAAAGRAPESDAAILRETAARISRARPLEVTFLARRCLPLVQKYQDRRSASCTQPIVVDVDRVRARHGAWYELFPRSAVPSGEHGTFADVESLLPYISDMGFDVLYLPPIHPIGRTNRKGPNGSSCAEDHDPGSPWAIGSAEGGHTAIHPQLGTMEDFRHLVAAAASRGLEVALDIAFQCAPDHPWVHDHPGWFRMLPDGSPRLVENPPKRYEDIVGFDFECPDWRELWLALLEVVQFWAEEGVRIFRVDNPHTKPIPFWEWLIAAVRREHPDVIFLAEAFTRPAVMHLLAKVGFSQSYTYFTWRNTKAEIEEYFTNLMAPPASDYFRPSLWPNTPDILSDFLQTGGREAFVARFVLASMLGANYGIYGPAFELCEDAAREPVSEEYRDAEKYQIRTWDLESPASLRTVITRVNEIRREHPALQQDLTLAFHETTNDQLLCFSKHTPEGDDLVLVVVNLDPHLPQSGYVHVNWQDLGFEMPTRYRVHDLLNGGSHSWEGSRNPIVIDPGDSPAQVLVPVTRHRTERDFDYYQ